MGKGLATYPLYKYLKKMKGERLHEAYYQGDRLWTNCRMIKELHKIIFTPKKYVKSLLAKQFHHLRKINILIHYEVTKLLNNISLVCFMYLIMSLKETYTSTHQGHFLGIVWKVAQSLQKCPPPWLTNKENFTLRNG